jgi:transcription elongation factor Elf1
MAAGTGLLTGSIADAYAPEASSCPRCNAPTVAIHVVDLVERRTDLCCRRCQHYWTVSGVPAER